ncbi:MAG: CRTAC1 family protein [Pseudomonadota bacterium]
MTLLRLLQYAGTLLPALIPWTVFATQTYSGDIPRFEETAIAAGIDHEYTGPWEYFVGGGVAVLDCNGDYKPDLFFAGGDSAAALYVNESVAGGALKFEHKADYLGIALKAVTGAYPLDVDNDGDMDLAIMRVGKNRLLRGNGDCTFDHDFVPFQLTTNSNWTTAFSAHFEPTSPYPTLVFGNYVDRIAPGSPWGTCDDHDLYKPIDSRGTLNPDKPLYPEPRALTPGYCALSMLFTDWNRSGRNSLRVTNDRQYHRGGEEQLWHFEAGAQPRLYTKREGWQKVVIWGMGIASGDLNADGFPEYALTSMGDTKLQQLELDVFEENGWPQYRDIAYENGATAHRPYTGDDLKPSTGWHAEFDDVNNDGLLDLFIAKGNVEQMPDFASFDPDNLLLAKHDGGFYEAGLQSGIALPTRGRGGALTDLNHDGLLDLVVVNRDSNVSMFQNTGAIFGNRSRPTGNWLQIKLKQNGINRNAVGAKVSVKSGNATRTRTVQVGGGHASGDSGFIHVGLGVAERASIRVQWPDGQWSAAFRAFANNFLIIERNSADPVYWYPQ